MKKCKFKTGDRVWVLNRKHRGVVTEVNVLGIESLCIVTSKTKFQEEYTHALHDYSMLLFEEDLERDE